MVLLLGRDFLASDCVSGGMTRSHISRFSRFGTSSTSIGSPQFTPDFFIMKSPEIPWWGTGRTPAEGLWNDGLPDLAARTKYSACGAADVAQFVSLKTHGGLFWFRQTIRYHTLYIYIYICIYTSINKHIPINMNINIDININIHTALTTIYTQCVDIYL